MSFKEYKIEKLAKMQSINSYVPGQGVPYNEAYLRIMKKIESSIQDEKNFDREWQESLKKLDDEERKKEELRAAMNRHYFKQLKEQISENEVNRYSKSQPRGTETEFMKEEGYVWKGMNRIQWREILDRQIKEKNQMRDNMKKMEIEKDQKRIEMAKQSLDEEVKVKEIKKRKIQTDMWESWEKTKEVKRMQQELDKIRRYGDSDSRNTSSPSKQTSDYFDNILKGYENTFGKIKNTENISANAGRYIIKSKKLFRKRSKSSLLNHSSYTNASIKLGELIREEEELKRQKNELLRTLQKSNKFKT